MEMSSLDGKTNFFEKRVMDYSKANIFNKNKKNNGTDFSLELNDDF